MTKGSDYLPQGWLKTSISELFVFNPKHSPNLPDDLQIAFIPMQAVDDVDGVIKEQTPRLLGEVRSGYTHFAEGDVIFAKITPCMENGKAAIARNLINGLACGSTEFFVLRSQGAILPEYLHCFIRQENYRRSAKAAMTGVVGQSRVPKDFVLQTSISLPPLNEQLRIVAKIESLFTRSRNAREALEKIPPLLEKFRQSVLAAAFRGDLTAQWRAKNPDVEPASALLDRIRAERRRRWEETELAKMRAKGKEPLSDQWKSKYVEPEPVDTTDLPELPEGWEWIKLEELRALEPNSMTDGPFGSNLKTSDYVESGVRVVRLGNIGIGEFFLDGEAFITFKKYETLKKHEIFGDDLVIAALAEPVGRCCQVPGSLGTAIVKADCIRFKPHTQILPHYLMHWLNSPPSKKQTEDASHGIGRLRINMENLRSLPIPVAPLSEQVALAEAIKRMMTFAEITANNVETAFTKITILDQSILAKAFRGELVPQDLNDEPASVLLERIKAERAANIPKKQANRKTAQDERVKIIPDERPPKQMRFFD